VLCVRQAICYGMVDTPKSGHDREVPVTRALRGALAQSIAGKSCNALAAPTGRERPWGQGGLRDMFLRVAKRTGIVGSTMHHMRHGFVTALLDEGVGAHIVKELAGHADLTTTERYAHAWSSASAPRSRSSTGSTRGSSSSPRWDIPRGLVRRAGGRIGGRGNDAVTARSSPRRPRPRRPKP
jgi:hypothetical protein